MAVHVEDYPGEWHPGGWFTHEHSHVHPPDQESLNHQREFSHRHEHRWHPDQRHHHDLDSARQRRPDPNVEHDGQHCDVCSDYLAALPDPAP